MHPSGDLTHKMYASRAWPSLVRESVIRGYLFQACWLAKTSANGRSARTKERGLAQLGLLKLKGSHTHARTYGKGNDQGLLWARPQEKDKSVCTKAFVVLGGRQMDSAQRALARQT